MKRGKIEIRIGTSGWHYWHWAGRFYPEDLPKSDWLKFYTKSFDTVELNNTFYHLPKHSSIKTWHKQTPKNFLYAVKASRYITHIKRLKNISEELNLFYETISPLKSKLGPILFQLPPSFKKNLKRLEDLLKLLPRRKLAAIEFRNDSWYTQATYDLLNKYGVGFCTHDLPGLESPRIVAGKLIYLRFHGTESRYAGNYSQSALQNYANWLKENSKTVTGIYVYFNNDYNAYAVTNAKQLKEML
jgi:uncharacterized protein YecE (DUF72 family)